MLRRQSPPRDSLELQAQQHAALTLWLVNVFLGVLVGTAYLRHLPAEVSARAWVFVVFGLVSSVATLALIPAAISWATVRFMPRAAHQGWVQALVGAAFLSMMKVDTVVYSLLRYHFFSSAVLNVAVTSGSEDAVHLGGRVWWPVVLVVSLLTSGQFFLWRHMYRRRLDADSPREFSSIFSRPAAIWGLVLLTVIGVEKSIYAAADLEGDREVHNASDVLPAYSQWRVSELLDEDGDPRLVVRPKGEPLAYPIEWPTIAADGPRPNVLLLVIDSWRRDQLNAEVTPQLHALAQEGRNFENHCAGGNGTRFGIFGMLYGLHGSYWFSFLEERRGPVLLDVLRDAGYERQVFSSASMGFPEFRDTAWVGELENVHDDFGSEIPYERDLAVAEAFETFLEGRKDEQSPAPFFSFVLIDAAHQPYESPPGGRFQPAADRLDYIELANDRSPELVERVFNRYRNALHFADGVAAGLVESLRQAGELENTIVIITGDHGEEFQESGFWGHTSNFTPEQIEVPFFMLGAGVEVGVEERPTCHIDIAPTLLEYLGANPALRGAWCLGENLFDPPMGREPVVSGWAHVGVLTDQGIFRVRMGGKGGHDIDVFDESWQPQADAETRILEEAQTLRRVSDECRRFLLGAEAQ